MQFIVLGLIVGGLRGILGLGGGIFLVPALILLFHFTPPQAQGTSLAVLIPPIGVFAALEYYRKGLIEFRVVGLICLGFVLGASTGAFFVDHVPVTLMRRVLGCFMLSIALQMVFTSPDGRFGFARPGRLWHGVARARLATRWCRLSRRREQAWTTALASTPPTAPESGIGSHVLRG